MTKYLFLTPINRTGFTLYLFLMCLLFSFRITKSRTISVPPSMGVSKPSVSVRQSTNSFEISPLFPLKVHKGLTPNNSDPFDLHRLTFSLYGTRDNRFVETERDQLRFKFLHRLLSFPSSVVGSGLVRPG